LLKTVRNAQEKLQNSYTSKSAEFEAQQGTTSCVLVIVQHYLFTSSLYNFSSIKKVNRYHQHAINTS